MKEYHGMKVTPEYEAWCGMKKRCYNKRCHGYANWGGRGITVCDRWLHSFVNFYADMGKKPAANYSLDRVKNSKGYSPENCRWATRRQQAINRRIRGNNEYRGVRRVTSKRKWVAKIKYGPKLVHLGSFDDPQQAALAYDCGAVQIFGRDAILNFPAIQQG